jgi:hypothetical protein
MSGGTFEYRQYQIGYIADVIEDSILNNGKERPEKPRYDWDSTHYPEYPDEIIDKFKEAVKIIRTAQIYAQRIDWLMAGDDGEESFLKRLQEDLEELKQQDK